MYFVLEIKLAWSRPWTLFKVASTLSRDYRILLWATTTYQTKRSIFSWWHDTLGLMMDILLGGIAKRSVSVLRHSMTPLLNSVGKLAPNQTYFTGLSSSWTISKYPCRNDLEVFTLVPNEKSESSFRIVWSLHTSRSVVSMMRAMAPLSSFQVRTIAYGYLKTVSWIKRTLCKLVWMRAGLSKWWWYFIFRWTMEATTSNVVRKNHPRI